MHLCIYASMPYASLCLCRMLAPAIVHNHRPSNFFSLGLIKQQLHQAQSKLKGRARTSRCDKLVIHDHALVHTLLVGEFAREGRVRRGTSTFQHTLRIQDNLRRRADGRNRLLSRPLLFQDLTQDLKNERAIGVRAVAVVEQQRVTFNAPCCPAGVRHQACHREGSRRRSPPSGNPR